jgi:GntR family transcriptional regulator
VPLYHQVANMLQARIFTRTASPGSLLGTEKDLARAFGVSRVTVRKAIDLLVRDGLVEPRRGRGTFVAADAQPVAPATLHLFLEDLLARTESLPTVYEHCAVAASPLVAERLGIRPGTRVMRVQRCVQRAADGTSDWVVYFVSTRLWRRLGVEQSRGETLLALIDRTPGLRLASGRQLIQAIAADDETAARLQIAVGTPIMRADREYQTEDGRTVLFGWVDHTSSGIPILLSRAR